MPRRTDRACNFCKLHQQNGTRSFLRKLRLKNYRLLTSRDMHVSENLRSRLLTVLFLRSYVRIIIKDLSILSLPICDTTSIVHYALHTHTKSSSIMSFSDTCKHYKHNMLICHCIIKQRETQDSH